MMPLQTIYKSSAVPTNGGAAIYSGRRLLGSKDAGRTYAGYFDYNFLRPGI